MSKDNYHRFPSDEKLRGVDYRFYNQLLAGKFDREINQGLAPSAKAQAGTYEDALIKA
jgi:hypothetical protein